MKIVKVRFVLEEECRLKILCIKNNRNHMTKMSHEPPAHSWRMFVITLKPNAKGRAELPTASIHEITRLS